MEGNGEGLMAIVEGLDTPGVTLTVCSRPRLHLERRRLSRHRLNINPVSMPPEVCSVYQGDIRLMQGNSTSTSPEVQRMSVETSTECVKGTDCGKSSTGAQICDGRYASSYKLAHCMMTPTSPPEAVSEFPPQRKEPCRNQGNFEIGQQWNGLDSGLASGQGRGLSGGHSGSHVRVTASRVKHCRGSQISGDKGSSHHFRSSYRDMEAFAQSLRKYPSIDPYRTASTDLIEKIIRYTQAKSSQEPSRTTRSMRNLQQQKSSDAYDMSGTSKHQQTYSRRNDDVTSNNCHLQDSFKEGTRNFKLYSDSRNMKDSSYKDCFSSSYDYLKAGNSRNGRTYHSDGSPSPDGSKSREELSPERSRSPVGSRSPVRSKSHIRTSRMDRARRPDRTGRLSHSPVSSAGNVSLSDMSKYIRGITIRQICKDRPLVFQVCPKLKNRYNQHKKICRGKNGKSSESFENAEGQVSGSVLSRLMSTFSGGGSPSTTQEACQCFRNDCCCSKATQCTFGPKTSDDQVVCTCKSSAIKMNPNIPCSCSGKYQEKVYYNKRIDEEISDWLKGVPVLSCECPESKMNREIAIRQLRYTLKQLPDDEYFGENATNVINEFVEDYPMWNPGTENDEEVLFKSQLAEKLTDQILSVPRKSDRFKDIVKKWIVNLNLEDDEVDREVIIDNIVNKLKSLAVERPVCDFKYIRILNNAIIELLIELSLFDGDTVTLKKMANKLAKEIVAIPKNVVIDDMTSDLTAEFKDIVCDWMCEHGMCKELKRNPNLIYALAKRLNAMKSQGVNDKMKEEMNRFEDDVGTAFKTIDELIEELTNQLSKNGQSTEKLLVSDDEIITVITDWLRTLPGGTSLDPQEFNKITKEVVKLVEDSKERGFDTLGIDIVDCLLNANLPIDLIEIYDQVEELLRQLNILPSSRFYKEKAEKKMVHDIFNIIDRLPVPEDKKEEMKNRSRIIIHEHVNRSESNYQQIDNEVKDQILEEIVEVISKEDMLRKSIRTLKSVTRFSSDSSDLKEIISKDVKSAVNELPIDTYKKKHLMQQVNGTLSKNMDKPLPYNVKSCIYSGISDIVETCPIAEDRGVVCCLKKLLSAVVTNHLNMFLSKPKCVCNIQSTLEKDVSVVIDNAPIDAGKKRDLKKCIQNILKENEGSRLSNEVIKTIKDDINGAVNDLPIPEDKKNMLKNVVGETVSKNVDEASPGLRHDLYKIRNKLLDDTIKVIEKCPVSREVKSHLISKLEPMLAENLDSSLSDEEKYMIIDDVSEIFRETMPEDKIKRLESKLAQNLDAYRMDEEQTEIINNLLNNTLQEMEKAIDEASIPKDNKVVLKNKLSQVAIKTFNKPSTDNVQEVFNNNINNFIKELNIINDKNNQLKSKLIHAVNKYMSILQKKINDLETKPLYTKRKSSIDLNGKYGKKEKALMPIKELDESKSRTSARRKDDPSELRRTKSSSVSITGPLTPKEIMKHETKRTVKKSQIPEEKKSKLRLELMTVLSGLFPEMDSHPDIVLESPTQRSPQPETVATRSSPQRETVPTRSSPQPEAVATQSSLQRETVAPKSSPQRETVATKSSLQRETVATKSSPQPEAVATRSSPQPETVAPKSSPQRETVATKSSHQQETVATKSSPQRESVAPRSSPQRESVAPRSSPQVSPQASPQTYPQVSPQVSRQVSNQVSPQVSPQGAKRNSAQSGELIDRARNMSLKEQMKDLFSEYGIDPSYQKQLLEELNNLVDLTLSGGDIEEARRKLIEKIMRDMNLSYEEACALADDMIERARILAAKEALEDIFKKYGIDSSYENKLAEEFTKLVDIAFAGGDLEEARTQLIKKIMQDTKLSNKQASALVDEMVKRARRLAVKEELKDIFNRYDIAPSYENQAADEFIQLVDLALSGGDLDEARNKLIDKVVRGAKLSKDQATAFVDELVVKAREKLLASKAQDSCATSFLYEKSFSKAITNTVDQSSISVSEKSSLKEILLTKLKENISEIRFINNKDIEAIKNKIVTDSYDIVDATSIATEQKDEIKLALKEELDKVVSEGNQILGVDDDEAFTAYEDEVRDCIKSFMDSLGIQVDPEILEAFIKDLVGDIIDRHKYLNAHPEIIITKKDEMENFNYQVFRRAKQHMGLKTTLQIMKGAGELYKMILALGPPLPSSKLRLFCRTG